MTTQTMVFELKVNGSSIKEGTVIANGSSVYEMTENVCDQLVTEFGVTDLDVDFVDVSNVWTFEGNKDDHVYTIEFAPDGIKADKFGLED